MLAAIESKQPELHTLCIKHGVLELFAFGSAVTGSFTPGKSDFDFLVQFASCSPGERADRYFGLLTDLEDLFESHIDLVEIGAIENPHFKRDVEASRVQLYAA